MGRGELYVVRESGTMRPGKIGDTLRDVAPFPGGSIISPSCFQSPVFSLLPFLDNFEVLPCVDVIGRDIAQPFVIAPVVVVLDESVRDRSPGKIDTL